MANVEQISQVAMQVITYAGMAKSNYLEALKYYRVFQPVCENKV